MAMLLAGCGSASGSSSPTASSAPLEGPPAVSVHPVLSSAPCGTDATVAIPDREHGLCYRLGPAFIFRADLVDPQVVEKGGAFSVTASIKGEARARADRVFEACRTGKPTCPAFEGGHGAIAVVVDRVVESAPLVDKRDLAEKGIALRGDLTEDDAYRIVDALSR